MTSFVLFELVNKAFEDWWDYDTLLTRREFIILFIPFLKFLSVSIPMYSFNQASWLNLIALWTFFNTNPLFNPCFTFLMCITYSFLLCKSATSFSTYTIFIISGKRVNHYTVYAILQDIEHQLQKSIFHDYLNCSFL